MFSLSLFWAHIDTHTLTHCSEATVTSRRAKSLCWTLQVSKTRPIEAAELKADTIVGEHIEFWLGTMVFLKFLAKRKPYSICDLNERLFMSFLLFCAIRWWRKGGRCGGIEQGRVRFNWLQCVGLSLSSFSLAHTHTHTLELYATIGCAIISPCWWILVAHSLNKDNPCQPTSGAEKRILWECVCV